MSGFLGEEPMDLRTFEGDGSWGADGEFSKGSESIEVTKFVGTFRPAPKRLIQLLPIGDREKDVRILYTQRKLVTNSQHNQTPPDLVRRSKSISEAWYEVTDIGESMDSLPDAPIAHRSYICVREQEVEA